MAERDANNGQFFQFLSALQPYYPPDGMNLESEMAGWQCGGGVRSVEEMLKMKR
jgi:hypothetical protein